MEALKTGKNDPCACGSGKKFRQCCWLKRLEWAKYEPPPVQDTPEAKQMVTYTPSTVPTFWRRKPGHPGVLPPPPSELIEWFYVKDKGWTHESQLKPDDLLRTTEGRWETRYKDIVIRTTHEHPFFVKDKGWTPLGEIQPGDEIRGEDGWVVVKNVDHTGVWGKVYNLRIEDHHTYFVGKPEWGFSVWAHNAECAIVETQQGRFEVVELPQQVIFTTNGLSDAVRFAQQNGHTIRSLTLHGQDSVPMSIAEQLPHLTNVPPDLQQVLVGEVPLLNGLFPELQTPLPVYSGSGETRGVFVYRAPGGRVEVPLVSGEAGPGQVFSPPGARLDFPTRQAVTHVEGHAAGLMQSFGIQEASVYVNYFNLALAQADKAGPCAHCRTAVPRLLPKEAQLNMYFVAEGGGYASGHFIGKGAFHQIYPPPSNIWPPHHMQVPKSG